MKRKFILKLSVYSLLIFTNLKLALSQIPEWDSELGGKCSCYASIFKGYSQSIQKSVIEELQVDDDGSCTHKTEGGSFLLDKNEVQIELKGLQTTLINNSNEYFSRVLNQSSSVISGASITESSVNKEILLNQANISQSAASTSMKVMEQIIKNLALFHLSHSEACLAVPLLIPDDSTFKNLINQYKSASAQFTSNYSAFTNKFFDQIRNDPKYQTADSAIKEKINQITKSINEAFNSNEGDCSNNVDSSEADSCKVFVLIGGNSIKDFQAQSQKIVDSLGPTLKSKIIEAENNIKKIIDSIAKSRVGNEISFTDINKNLNNAIAAIQQSSSKNNNSDLSITIESSVSATPSASSKSSSTSIIDDISNAVTSLFDKIFSSSSSSSSSTSASSSVSSSTKSSTIATSSKSSSNLPSIASSDSLNNETPITSEKSIAIISENDPSSVASSNTSQTVTQVSSANPIITISKSASSGSSAVAAIIASSQSSTPSSVASSAVSSIINEIVNLINSQGSSSSNTIDSASQTSSISTSTPCQDPDQEKSVQAHLESINAMIPMFQSQLPPDINIDEKLQEITDRMRSNNCADVNGEFETAKTEIMMMAMANSGNRILSNFENKEYRFLVADETMQTSSQTSTSNNVSITDLIKSYKILLNLSPAIEPFNKILESMINYSLNSADSAISDILTTILSNLMTNSNISTITLEFITQTLDSSHLDIINELSSVFNETTDKSDYFAQIQNSKYKSSMIEQDLSNYEGPSFSAVNIGGKMKVISLTFNETFSFIFVIDGIAYNLAKLITSASCDCITTPNLSKCTFIPPSSEINPKLISVCSHLQDKNDAEQKLRSDCSNITFPITKAELVLTCDFQKKKRMLVSSSTSFDSKYTLLNANMKEDDFKVGNSTPSKIASEEDSLTIAVANQAKIESLSKSSSSASSLPYYLGIEVIMFLSSIILF